MIGWQIAYWAGRRQEEFGNLEKAKSIYTYLYRKGEEDNAKVLFRLGHVHFSMDRYQESEKFLKLAIGHNSGIAEWHYRLGFVEERLEDHESAVACYAQALALNDNNGQWHYRRGRTLSNLGKHSDAAEEYRAAIEREPNQGKFHEALARAVRSQSVTSWKELEVLQAGAVHHKSDVDWQLRLAQVLESLNRFSEASEYFSRASELEPRRAFLHYRYGYALERTGELEARASAFKRAVELETKLGAKDFGIGVFHEARSLWKPAVDAYVSYANSLPFVDKRLNERIAWCYEKLGNWKVASKYRQQIVQQHPSSDIAHLNISWTLEQAGDQWSAQEIYSFVLDNSEQPFEQWRRRYARVLETNGNYEHAALQYLIAVGRGADLEEYRNGCDPSSDHASQGDVGPQSVQIPVQRGFTATRYADRVLTASSRQALSSQDVEVLRSAVKFADNLNRLDVSEAINAQLHGRDESSSNKSTVDYAVSLYLRKKYRDACNVVKTVSVLDNQSGVHVTTGYPKGKWTSEVLEYYEFSENLPVESRVVLYESHMGSSIDCNPFAIYKSLIDDETYSGYTHVWVISPQCAVPTEILNRSNVILVTHGSRLYRRYLATAKYLINNVTFQNYFVRREGQKYLNTWHGTPIKTLGKDMGGTVLQHSNVTRNFLQCTHMLSPDPHTTRVLTEAYDIDQVLTAKIAELGYPRNDLALNISDSRRARIVEQLGIDVDADRPVVLYAPTWRGEVGESNFEVAKLHEDLDALSGTGAKVLFRAHPITEKLLVGSSLGVTAVPKEINSNELLSVVDVLVTDYSSIAIDAIACGVRVYLYTYDIDRYKEERGLYFGPEQISPFVFNTIEALCGAVKSRSGLADGENSSAGVSGQDTFVVSQYQDGCSSKRATDFFFEDDDQHCVSVKTEDRISILVRASLIPNGVTSSFLNLVHQLDPIKYSITLLVDAGITANDESRLSKFRELPDHVRVVGRVGPRVPLSNEKWQESLLTHQHNLWSPDSWQVYFRSYRREYQRIFGDSQFDYVIEYDGYSLFWASLLACAHPAKASLIYLHSEMYQEWLSRAAYLEGIFRLYLLFDRLVCVSDPIARLNADELGVRFDIDREKFVGGGNFLNLGNVRARSGEELDEDLVAWLGVKLDYLTTVGRISPEKDQLKLVRAFKSVVDTNPSARLVIVGDGPQYSALVALVKDLGLKQNVFLAGYRDNPFPIMRASVGFVLSSNHEGQPMVLLEALALGVPVLSTDIAGARALLGDEMGVLVTNTVDGLAAGLERFVRREEAPARFDVEAYTCALLEKFENDILRLV